MIPRNGETARWACGSRFGEGQNAKKSLRHSLFRPRFTRRSKAAFGPLQRVEALLYAPPFANHVRLFLGSSAVEHSTVNRMVAGSNPARGAIDRFSANFPERPRTLQTPQLAL